MMQAPKRSPKPFRFSDPRQRRIYEELKELVGEGPAAFFRDACWIMENPRELECTAHFVGHALREIESALRGVLRPLAIGGKKSHKEEIQQILQFLGLTKDSPEERAWMKLADILHELAHRRELSPPRPIDEVRELWVQIQELLLVVLEGIRHRFLEWFRILDTLLAKSQPTDDDLKTLANNIPNNLVTRRYLFERLNSPEWLERLRKRGFFKSPPSAEWDEERAITQHPIWPEARYLARMAAHKPQLVAEIIREMADTDNIFVQTDLLEAMLAMPAEIASTLFEKAKRWAEQPFVWFPLLPEKFGQLIGHLAKGGKAEEALALAMTLLDVREPEEPETKETDLPFQLPPRPQARLDAWDYKQILEGQFMKVVEALGLPAFEGLCNLLEKAVSIQCRDREGKRAEHLSHIWRPAVEEHEQNLSHTVEDALVSAIRDAGIWLVKNGKASVEKVVTTLEKRRKKIFHRIALHLLRVYHDQEPKLVRERLTNRSLFDDIHLHHEYALLLKQCFRQLSLEDQKTILGWIETGPEEEGDICLREIWQRDRLALIGDDLPAEWKERYQALAQKYGEPEHPEFVSDIKSWVGPSSPLTGDELRAMSLEEIVNFLRSWKPPDIPFGAPSPEGLGRVLSSIVSENPERFAKEAEQFQGLGPTYVRDLLWGFCEALKQGKTFDWAPVLQLSQWVVNQLREIKGRTKESPWMMKVDSDWGWARKTVARLLEEGFQERQGSIPFEFREIVWQILHPLTEDPDPTPEEERKSNSNPVTLSINTVRGEAMHAVIRYALWVRRHLEERKLWQGFKEIPEVQEVLEHHLDVSKDPSLAIRSVYGQWFAYLVWIDKEWARHVAHKVFPMQGSERDYFNAAWNAYVIFCHPCSWVFEILRDIYAYAVQRIEARSDEEKPPLSPEGRLAEHLMVFYWQGVIDLQDDLFVTFWQKASDKLRAHALTFIGRSLLNTDKPIPQEILQRLKNLWEWRWEKSQRSLEGSQEELAAFGWWFASGAFDEKWAISQLLRVLQQIGKVDYDYLVVKKLLELAARHPSHVVESLAALAKGDREGWKIYDWNEAAKGILSLALRDKEAAPRARDLINYLGSRGFLEFRELLKDDL